MPRESVVQSRIVRDLKQRGYWSIKQEPRSMVGLPDLLILSRGGLACFVEVKTETGKLSSKQNATITALEERGYTVLVVYGLLQWDAIKDEYFPKLTKSIGEGLENATTRGMVGELLSRLENQSPIDNRIDGFDVDIEE